MPWNRKNCWRKLWIERCDRATKKHTHTELNESPFKFNSLCDDIHMNIFVRFHFFFVYFSFFHAEFFEHLVQHRLYSFRFFYLLQFFPVPSLLFFFLHSFSRCKCMALVSIFFSFFYISFIRTIAHHLKRYTFVDFLQKVLGKPFHFLFHLLLFAFTQ